MESFGHKMFITSQPVPLTGMGVLYPRVRDFFLSNLHINKIEMDDHNLSSFNYHGEEMLLNQFSILAENIQKAFPPGHEGSQRNADQIKCLKTKRERWPEKIIQTWLKRNISVFSSEAVTKLIQAYCSMVEEVNESRKRQRESLRADLNRRKKN